MTESKKNKINLYDRYIMQGGDMTLDEIETFVKNSLGVSNVPLKKDMFAVSYTHLTLPTTPYV